MTKDAYKVNPEGAPKGVKEHQHRWTKIEDRESATKLNKKHDMAKKMKEGIHRVGSNPSRFVHKGKKGDIDLYETWKGGKQSIKSTK